LVSILLAACAPASEQASPPVEGPSPAPAYAALTLAGDTVTLESLRGQPVLLNLWATWCAPCRKETPYLQRVHARLESRGLRVVGVSLDAPAMTKEVEEFVKEYGVTYTILRDPKMTGMDVFQLPGLPATYLIDADGRVVWKAIGGLRAGEVEFEAAVEALLASAGS
jgi:cytochrome c biogenesis protein CcmG, thiol:disulfide interchange protein DsbE